jgi:hypothetical protein
MSCDERNISFGLICLSTEDLFMLILDGIVITIVISLIYINNVIRKKNNSLSIVVKNNFCYLSEGALSYFYSELNSQQKGTNQKKKIPQKAQIIPNSEKNNIIKCNQCGQNFNISYQYF